MSALLALLRRDIQVAIRIGGGALIGVLFFMSVVVLIPFAIGPDLALLQRIGPAILWYSRPRAPPSRWPACRPAPPSFGASFSISQGAITMATKNEKTIAAEAFAGMGAM